MEGSSLKEKVKAIKSELESALEKLNELKPEAIIQPENILMLLECLDLIDSEHDTFQSLALKGFALTHIKPEDLIGLHGSYIGKRSIKIYIYTLSCLDHKYYYRDNENFSDWINENRDGDFGPEKMSKIKNNTEFLEKFQTYLSLSELQSKSIKEEPKVNTKLKSKDSEELSKKKMEYDKHNSEITSLKEQLTEYLVVQGWVKFVQEIGASEWPSTKVNFHRFDY